MCTIWEKLINKKDLKKDSLTDSGKKYVYIRYICVIKNEMYDICQGVEEEVIKW